MRKAHKLLGRYTARCFQGSVNGALHVGRLQLGADAGRLPLSMYMRVGVQ